LNVDILAEGGGFFLRILETVPQNPIRNIRVLMPGFTEDQVRQNPWNPGFLARWSGMACLRFMDFQETNNSEQERWLDRPKLTDATWTRNGIPVEMLCDLSNRLKADPWFCIPHRADDDYVRQFAGTVQSHLNSERRIWIEYSNEVWNGQFAQHRYAADQGKQLGFASQPWEAAWRYTAHRSVQIFGICEEVLKGHERLVRVLPSQAANSYVSEQILGWQDAAQHADVLAIAPYISMNIPVEGRGLAADQVLQWDVDQFLDYVESTALPESIEWIAANQQVASRHKLALVCYEAGQHFVGIQGGENNEQLTQLLHAVNSHARMKTIYEQYFAAWQKHSGGLMCHFSSVGRWSKWGSWGLLQHADDEPATSPKFIAFMAWARELGQPVSIRR
jgi:hypothetical protein